MYHDRIHLYEQLEKAYSSKLIVYITSDRYNMSAQIAPDVIDFLIDQLDAIGPCDRISFYLYTRGGDVAAAWNIVNLLRMFADKLQVIVPHKAHSAGTIISLGADEIVMTKQATLGPIDPSLNSPLNPAVELQNGKRETIPVSVEAVKGYVDFARQEMNICKRKAMTEVLEKLSDYVHPLVLGQVYRTRSQIQMLAKRLLKNQIQDEKQIRKIVDFLCSDSGSHDYTINRREAKEELGLNIVNPTPEQYAIIKKIYDDISEELQFRTPFSIREINGAYAVRRSLLESVTGGSDYFVTEGESVHVKTKEGLPAVHDSITFNGWRHEELRSTYKTKGSVAVDREVLSYDRSDEFKM